MVEDDKYFVPFSCWNSDISIPFIINAGNFFLSFVF